MNCPNCGQEMPAEKVARWANPDGPSNLIDGGRYVVAWVRLFAGFWVWGTPEGGLLAKYKTEAEARAAVEAWAVARGWRVGP